MELATKLNTVFVFETDSHVRFAETRGEQNLDAIYCSSISTWITYAFLSLGSRCDTSVPTALHASPEMHAMAGQALSRARRLLYVARLLTPSDKRRVTTLVMNPGPVYFVRCADTSMTNFFAFMLGSATSLPAVKYFCLYAGAAILFDFFMQVESLAEPLVVLPRNRLYSELLQSVYTVHHAGDCLRNADRRRQRAHSRTRTREPFNIKVHTTATTRPHSPLALFLLNPSHRARPPLERLDTPVPLLRPTCITDHGVRGLFGDGCEPAEGRQDGLALLLQGEFSVHRDRRGGKCFICIGLVHP